MSLDFNTALQDEVTMDLARKTIAKETLMRDPILFQPDPNTPWIIETDASKTAFVGILLQHVYTTE